MATINIHHVKSMEAKERNGTTWLWIDGREDLVALHVDLRLAEMLAAAFSEYEAERRRSSLTPPRA